MAQGGQAKEGKLQQIAATPRPQLGQSRASGG
jgi:hypothetical protein